MLSVSVFSASSVETADLYVTISFFFIKHETEEKIAYNASGEDPP